MKKILTILLLLISIISNSQVLIPYQDKQSTFELDGQRKPLRSYKSYIGDSMLYNVSYTTNNDYFRNPNIFYMNDTMFLQFIVTNGHDYQQGGQRIVKYSKGSNGRFKYTTEVSDRAILYNNQSYVFNRVSGDTIVGTKIQSISYPSDSILFLDRNFNRIGPGAIFFDKAAAGLPSTFLNISKVVEDDSGYWYYAGYDRVDTPRNAYMLRSKNRGRSWTLQKTYTFSVNRFRPEEISIMKKGDTLIAFMRSDYGNFTWMSKSFKGVTWTDAVRVFKGANQPRSLSLNDSTIICTGRLFVWQDNDQGYKVIDDTALHNNGIYYGYVTYTTLNVSTNYGNTWRTILLGKKRVDDFGRYPSGKAMSSEVADVIQLGGDTIRVIWADGVYVDNTNDYGGISYTDVVVNTRKHGFVYMIGGQTMPQTYYQQVLRADSISLLDTLNNRYFNLDIDNTVLNVEDNIDTIRLNSTVKIVSGTLSVNTPEAEAGRAFDLRSTANNERFSGIGGNLAYSRVNTSAGSFRIRQAEGTLSAPTATNANRTLGSYSMGGYEGGYVDNFEILLTSAEAFSSANNRGTNLQFRKVRSGLASHLVTYFSDSLNNHWWGSSSTRPVSLSQRFTFDNGNISAKQNVIVDSSIYTRNLYTSNAPVSSNGTDSIYVRDGVTGQLKVVPPSYIRGIAKSYVDSSTGGISYIDTSVTLATPRNYTGGIIYTLNLDSLKTSVYDLEKPLGVQRFFRFSDTAISLDSGMWIDLLLYFKAQATTVNQEIDVWIEIGGGAAQLYRETFYFRSSGVDRSITYSLPASFARTTFASNGGKIKIFSSNNFSVTSNIVLNVDLDHRRLR